MGDSESVRRIFEDAAADNRHGAGEIEGALVRDLLEVRDRWRPEALLAGARCLAQGHPVMGNLLSLAERAAAGDLDGFASWLERRRDILEMLPQTLAEASWPRVQRSARIVTISRSSAIFAVVKGAWERGWLGSVVVLDGAPSGRGQDQAKRLATIGESVSQPDAAAPEWLEKTGTLVMVGADAVGRSSFINALGTRVLLELAQRRGVERILVADTGKDVSEDVLGDLERDLPKFRETTDREWMIFERIPVDLVSVRVTE